MKYRQTQIAPDLHGFCFSISISISLSLSPSLSLSIILLLNFQKQKLDPKTCACVCVLESFTAQKLDTEVVPMIFLISIVTFSNGWQGYFPYSARFPAFRRELDPECLLGGCQHVAITRNFLPPQFITEKKGNHRHQKNIPSRRYWFIQFSRNIFTYKLAPVLSHRSAPLVNSHPAMPRTSCLCLHHRFKV